MLFLSFFIKIKIYLLCRLEAAISEDEPGAGPALLVSAEKSKEIQIRAVERSKQRQLEEKTKQVQLQTSSSSNKASVTRRTPIERKAKVEGAERIEVEEV